MYLLHEWVEAQVSPVVIAKSHLPAVEDPTEPRTVVEAWYVMVAGRGSVRCTQESYESLSIGDHVDVAEFAQPDGRIHIRLLQDGDCEFAIYQPLGSAR